MLADILCVKEFNFLYCYKLHIFIHVQTEQVLWTFSLYLEAVAIIPQLVLLQRSKNVDNLTGNYVFFLGCAIIAN